MLIVGRTIGIVSTTGACHVQIHIIYHPVSCPGVERKTHKSHAEASDEYVAKVCEELLALHIEPRVEDNRRQNNVEEQFRTELVKLVVSLGFAVYVIK